jgi:hypothetical protein
MKNILLITAALVLLSGCRESNEEAVTMDSKVILKINEAATEYVERNKDLIKIVNRPPGVKFYTARWDQKKSGTAIFEHKDNTLSVGNVISITAMNNSSPSEEGLTKFHINSGLTPTDLIDHDQARKEFVLILKNVRKTGWNIFINEGDPRLRGKAMLDFVLSESPVSSMDADYEPTFAEWMNIPSNRPWHFYANHVYLTISFTREPTLLDPQRPGSYLISYTIESENEHYRSYITPKQKAQWKSALPSHLEYLPAMRTKKESEFRARGIKIDETYQDPPIPNLTE